MLGGRAAYRRFVAAGIGTGHVERYYQVEEQQFLGAAGCARRVRQRAGQPGGPMPRKPLPMAVEELAHRLQVDPSTLRSADRSRRATIARGIVSFLLVRRLGYRVADVAAALGRDAATISVIVSRLPRRVESNDRLAADMARAGRDV